MKNHNYPAKTRCGIYDRPSCSEADVPQAEKGWLVSIVVRCGCAGHHAQSDHRLTLVETGYQSASDTRHTGFTAWWIMRTSKLRLMVYPWLVVLRRGGRIAIHSQLSSNMGKGDFPAMIPVLSDGTSPKYPGMSNWVVICGGQASVMCWIGWDGMEGSRCRALLS